jgi:hypothetical protein
MAIIRRPQRAAALPRNSSSGEKAEMVCAANDDGPNGNRVNLFVRKSLKDEGAFVFGRGGWLRTGGSLEDITVKYVTADRKLTMNGYKHMGFCGSGQYLQFNL